MKVVALHTDFRIYWPARLNALNELLSKNGDLLSVIEIAGKGSPYFFAENRKYSNLDWHILFEDSTPEELSGKEIKPILFKMLDTINPDVIISGAIAFPSGALAVQWANSRRNKRVVVFDDAKIDAVKRSGFVNLIKQNVYNGVDAMFYPAEPWSNTGKFWKFKEEQMFWGVDVVDNDFLSSPIDSHLYNFKYFVSVGRQVPKKNFLGILQAYLQYCNHVGKDFAYKLVMIGDGPEHKNLLDFIVSSGLDDMVYCHKFMTQDELRTIYHDASVLCTNSNESETWGLVINEAMSCGCAIIASKECGATSVLVKENENGYHTSCYDNNSLVKAMIKYHNLTADQKMHMSETSSRIIANWNLNKFAQGAYEACQFAVNHPKRKRSLLSSFIINNWYGRYNQI